VSSGVKSLANGALKQGEVAGTLGSPSSTGLAIRPTRIPTD